MFKVRISLRLVCPEPVRSTDSGLPRTVLCSGAGRVNPRIMKERKKFETIRKISEIIYKLAPQKNIFLTIVDVKLPQKGGRMKIYLSIYPEKEIKKVIDYLNKRQKKIKEEIKRNIYLRYLPSEVIFYPSFEFKEAEKVLKLIDENTKKKKGPEN